MRVRLVFQTTRIMIRLIAEKFLCYYSMWIGLAKIFIIIREFLMVRKIRLVDRINISIG